MISKNMEKALNEQINAEMYSAYLYLSMESYFRSLDLSGFANWMRIQVQEEMVHAMKIYDFVDAPYPDHFHIYVYDLGGNYVDNVEVSWAAKGV